MTENPSCVVFNYPLKPSDQLNWDGYCDAGVTFVDHGAHDAFIRDDLTDPRSPGEHRDALLDTCISEKALLIEDWLKFNS